MDFYNNGCIFNFRGTVSIVSADNLASWSIGGYKTLSSATRKCRFCMATAEKIQSKVCVVNYVYTIHRHMHIQLCKFDYKCMSLYFFISFPQMITNQEPV